MKKRRIFSIFCISFLIFASALLSGCTSDKSQIIDNEKIAIQLINSEVVQSEEVSYVEKTVKATISSSSSSSTFLVDWALRWQSYSTEDISQYIKIEPLTDDSTTCYVRCYKPFKTPIILLASVRNRKATASCIINFEGIPSSFIINPSINTDDEVITKIEEGTKLNIDFIFNNIFGVVQFEPIYIIETKAVGTLYFSNGIELPLESFVNPLLKLNDFNSSGVETEKDEFYCNDYLTYKIIDNNKIEITAIDFLKNLSAKKIVSDVQLGDYELSVSNPGFALNEPYYVQFNIREEKTNLSISFKICIIKKK